jgi:phosphoglycolate phosphatase-like HAD superfamily hydrolase
LNTLCSDDLFVFDVDNTLAQNWGIYDEAYRRTSRQILGQEFIMTRNPDGSEDWTFSRMTNPQLLEKRLSQLSIKLEPADVDRFFAAFANHAIQAAQDAPSNIYPGTEEFLAGLKGARLVLLSGGPIKLQLAALKPIVHYFDLSNSLFLGEFKNKRDALERITCLDELRNFVCIGDAPSDMEACTIANVAAMQKLAVGVVFSGLVTKTELSSAGANLVLNDYSQVSLAELKQVLTYKEAP